MLGVAVVAAAAVVAAMPVAMVMERCAGRWHYRSATVKYIDPNKLWALALPLPPADRAPGPSRASPNVSLECLRRSYTAKLRDGTCSYVTPPTHFMMPKYVCPAT